VLASNVYKASVDDGCINTDRAYISVRHEQCLPAYTAALHACSTLCTPPFFSLLLAAKTYFYIGLIKLTAAFALFQLYREHYKNRLESA